MKKEMSEIWKYAYDIMKREEAILESTFLISPSGTLPWTFTPVLFIFFDYPFIFASLP